MLLILLSFYNFCLFIFFFFLFRFTLQEHNQTLRHLIIILITTPACNNTKQTSNSNGNNNNIAAKREHQYLVKFVFKQSVNRKKREAEMHNQEEEVSTKLVQRVTCSAVRLLSGQSLQFHFLRFPTATAVNLLSP